MERRFVLGRMQEQRSQLQQLRQMQQLQQMRGSQGDAEECSVRCDVQDAAQFLFVKEGSLVANHRFAQPIFHLPVVHHPFKLCCTNINLRQRQMQDLQPKLQQMQEKLGKAFAATHFHIALVWLQLNN